MKADCTLLDQYILPRIQPIFDSQKNNPYNVFYRDAINHVLHEILSDSIDFVVGDDRNAIAEQRRQLHSLLPLVTSRSCCGSHGEMSFFSLSKFRENSFKFFFDMICSWLIPGKRLNVSMIYAVDFRMPELGDDIYTLCEVKIHLQSQQELDQILRNLPIIETELRLGIESNRYARRILEIKGLSTDEKTALIQEDIAYLINRLPQVFDLDVLTEMQHVLIMCRDEFKANRECRHLSRIISLHYIFRKGLRDAIKKDALKRHLSLKLFRARLNSPIGSRKVLSIVVAVNFFRDKEVFEKSHILKAIQSFIPAVQAVESSYFANRHGSEQVCTMYLEVEKSNGEEFSSQEIRLLRRKLPSELKDRVEHLMHPVFMPRNEEEIIRNIVSLSSQIKYLRDIPQVFISFDEQSQTNLFFTVILVRVLKPDAQSIQEMFKNTKSTLTYIHDRIQNAGSVRKKYKKEATVFRVKFSKEPFLRVDHSIDLNKARQAVVSELYKVIGEFRDFNGGMISKQNELLSEMRDLLSKNMKFNDLLLENFFYSVTPVIMRNVLEAEPLCTLFLLLLESIEHSLLDEKYSLKFSIQPQFVFAMVKVDDRSAKDEISRALAKLQLHSSELANSFVSVYDIIYLGYIYRTDEQAKQHTFCQTLQHAVENWEKKHHFQPALIR